jgi:hypothetical protein
VTRLADALVVALRADGAQVRVDRREAGFALLVVTVSTGDPWRWRSPVTHGSTQRCSWRSAERSAPTRSPRVRRAAAGDLV